jgi:hypothetical protein
MAVSKPVGDNARKGAVRKRSQLETKIMGEKHWTKRSKESGLFMGQKEKGKFKGEVTWTQIQASPGPRPISAISRTSSPAAGR